MNDEATNAAQPAGDLNFSIASIYIKDVSFETPNSPQIFMDQETFEIGMELANKAMQLNDDLYEVTLTLTVTAKVKDSDKTAYLIEVNQAGIFNIANIEQDHLGWMLGTYCPKILFPYARQTISDLVTKGGFPLLLLAPINFEAIYNNMQENAANPNQIADA